MTLILSVMQGPHSWRVVTAKLRAHGTYPTKAPSVSSHAKQAGSRRRVDWLEAGVRERLSEIGLEAARVVGLEAARVIWLEAARWSG